MRLPCRARHLLLMCLLGALATAARAQDAATGALGGIVADPSGAVVAGAAVQLHSADGDGPTASTTTDRLGEFLLPQLPPGDYQVTIRAAGFDPLLVERATVRLGDTERLRPQLTIAANQQTVQVHAAPQGPSFNSPLDANLSPSELVTLPQDGRRFQSLAAATPLFSAETASDSDNQRIAARGMDPMHNSYRLDGMSLTRSFDGEPRGGSALPFTVPQEGVREFQVRAGAFGNAPGRAAGGAVNTVTRRGEDTVHGSAFFLLRNSGLAAANPFAVATHWNNGAPVSYPVKPRDQREQFGGSLGGPLLQRFIPHLYGFVAAEGQRRSFPAISTPSNANFYNLTAEQTALLANRGVGAAATAQALSFLDSLTGELPRQANELALIPRLDLHPGSRTTLTAEWLHVRLASPSGSQSAPVVALGRGSVETSQNHGDTLIFAATSALSTRWIGQLRAEYARDAEFRIAPPPLPNEPQTGPAGTAPAVRIAGEFTFGDAAAAGARRLPEERRSAGSAEAVFNGRAHTVTVGIMADGIDTRVAARAASSGVYTYNSGTTGGKDGGLVDFITDYTYSATAYPNGGCPSIYATPHDFCFTSFRQSFGTLPETRFHTVAWSAFAGDHWRLTPRLSLDAGALYSYDRMPLAQQPNPALDALVQPFASSSTLPSDTNNLAPHLGIAYAPKGGGTVIRLGYGMHFGRVPGSAIAAALANTAMPTSQTTLRLTPKTIIDPACASAGTNFGYPATFTCSPFGPAIAANVAATVFARGFQVPAVQVGEFSVTHQIGSNISLSGSYVMGLYRQLQNTTDLNIAPSAGPVAFQIVRGSASAPAGENGARGGQIFNVPLYTSRISSAFGPVTGILSNATGTYNAAVLQVERRSARGLTGRAAWTYSKTLDTARSPGAVPNQDAQFDPFQPLYDRAPSNFDHRHRVVGSVVWQPVLARGGRAERRAANGWSVATVVLLQSGRPFSYGISGGTYLPGGRESLNGSGGANYLPSVGRNTLRLPWTDSVDLRVMRTVAGGDRYHLRLSAEAFNLFNHINITAVQGIAFLPGTPANGVTPLVFQDPATVAAEGITRQPFGTPSASTGSANRERRLQLGVRLEW